MAGPPGVGLAPVVLLGSRAACPPHPRVEQRVPGVRTAGGVGRGRRRSAASLPASPASRAQVTGGAFQPPPARLRAAFCLSVHPSVRPSGLSQRSGDGARARAPQRAARGVPPGPVPPGSHGARRGGRSGRGVDQGCHLGAFGLLLPRQLPLNLALRLFLTSPDIKIAAPIGGSDAGPSPLREPGLLGGQVRAWAAGGRAGGAVARSLRCPALPPAACVLPPACGARSTRAHPVGSRASWASVPGEKVLKEPIPSQLGKSDRGSVSP